MRHKKSFSDSWWNNKDLMFHRFYHMSHLFVWGIVLFALAYEAFSENLVTLGSIVGTWGLICFPPSRTLLDKLFEGSFLSFPLFSIKLPFFNRAPNFTISYYAIAHLIGIISLFRLFYMFDFIYIKRAIENKDSKWLVVNRAIIRSVTKEERYSSFYIVPLPKISEGEILNVLSDEEKDKWKKEKDFSD